MCCVFALLPDAWGVVLSAIGANARHIPVSQIETPNDSALCIRSTETSKGPYGSQPGKVALPDNRRRKTMTSIVMYGEARPHYGENMCNYRHTLVHMIASTGHLRLGPARMLLTMMSMVHRIRHVHAGHKPIIGVHGLGVNLARASKVLRRISKNQINRISLSMIGWLVNIIVNSKHVNIRRLYLYISGSLRRTKCNLTDFTRDICTVKRKCPHRGRVKCCKSLLSDGGKACGKAENIGTHHEVYIYIYI